MLTLSALFLLTRNFVFRGHAVWLMLLAAGVGVVTLVLGWWSGSGLSRPGGSERGAYGSLRVRPGRQGGRKPGPDLVPVGEAEQAAGE
ncbi:hypothetical protein GQ464_001490 [Rhodocaloribacter litoris]|uniref:hypothetical protein n=1 Tax=Rhodocaloribacter litoris TaxID=2558931 RepID=UPI001E5A5B84|nr:hypothetical protein [Rhodocaloribacter litoris]QXD15646.1 hypothetical protein GQ464_001490 [Rhodocaloribacter litoris]